MPRAKRVRFDDAGNTVPAAASAPVSMTEASFESAAEDLISSQVVELMPATQPLASVEPAESKKRRRGEGQDEVRGEEQSAPREEVKMTRAKKAKLEQQ